MNIGCSIDLTEEEEQQLAGILECPADELAENLEPYACAALKEYVRMLLGQKVFTRGSDFREYRLFLLIQHAFNNKIPEEQQICDRFQTTASQARALIRSVMSKYQYDLAQAIKVSLCEALDHAVWSDEEDAYLITVDNESIIHTLNRHLASIDGTLPPVTRRRGTVSTYIIKPSSREEVANRLGCLLPSVG